MIHQTIRETLQIDGINYVAEGEGAPVILIHGIAASLHDWTCLMPDLARAGYRAYAPDLPGHGDSDKPDDPEQYQVDKILQRVTQWIDSLKLEQPLLLVGHSLGGHLSLAYTRNYPERVKRLALIDPFYTPSQLSTVLRLARRKPALGAKTMRIIPEWLVNTVLGLDPTSATEFSPQARQQIANDYKRASPHFVYITKEIPDLTPVLPEIDAATRVMWGERDMTLKPESFPKLVNMLPNATGYPIAHSGHQPHIGKPKLVNKMILDFLDE
jgi:pimeloyl-ACP methyl ester carboxylesterase